MVKRPVMFKIRGVPTKDYSEGSDAEILQTFRVARAEKFATAEGQSAAVLVLEPVDMRPIENYLRDAAANALKTAAGHGGGLDNSRSPPALTRRAVRWPIRWSGGNRAGFPRTACRTACCRSADRESPRCPGRGPSGSAGRILA